MTRTIGTLGMVGVIALLACACGGAPPPGGDLPERGTDPEQGAPADEGDGDTAGDDDVAAPSQTDTDPASTDPAADPDTDADGVPDAKDCDPVDSAIAGVRLIDDALTDDANYFAPADGFAKGSWTYENSAYRQTRLVEGADATFFTLDKDVGDVDVEVHAISTEISGSISPRLRQMFILVGAKMDAGKMSGYGCGAEVVQGMSPETRTSVVKLSGAPSAIKTTAIQRTTRASVAVDEEFSLRAVLKDGNLTCTMTQGTKNTQTKAEATGLTGVRGSIGFFTRQTKAAFKDMKACKLEVPKAAAPK